MDNGQIFIFFGILGAFAVLYWFLVEYPNVQLRQKLAQKALEPAPAPVASPYKHLCNEHDKCLTVKDNSLDNGAVITQDTKKDVSGQLWGFTKSGGLCNKHGKCLSAAGDNPYNGTHLIQWDNVDQKGQKWSRNSEGYVCNEHGKCLAAPANTDETGHYLIQWDKTNEKGQKWSFK